jgi:hypothetical protein
MGRARARVEARARAKAEAEARAEAKVKGNDNVPILVGGFLPASLGRQPLLFLLLSPLLWPIVHWGMYGLMVE